MNNETKEMWLTSDLHFYHKNVIKYANRPFGDVAEMNEKILNSINEKVKINDEFYILGDFAFANKEKIENILKRINCKNIYLILGNHDEILRTGVLNSYFKKVVDYLEVKVPDASSERGSTLIVMSHYPILEWNQGHRGSVMCHGHTHGNLTYPESLKDKKIFDVGIDVWNQEPVNVKDILRKAQQRKNISHHD